MNTCVTVPCGTTSKKFLQMDLGELTELTEPSDWKFKPLEV